MAGRSSPRRAGALSRRVAERCLRVEQHLRLGRTDWEIAELEGVSTRTIRDDKSRILHGWRIAAAREGKNERIERLHEVTVERAERAYVEAYTHHRRMKMDDGALSAEVEAAHARVTTAIKELRETIKAYADHALGPVAHRVRIDIGGLSEGELAKRYGLVE